MDSPNAFPACNEANVNGTMGMTLRDHFAGEALQGWLASYDGQSDHPCEKGDYIAANIARWSYQIADAMLAERSREQSNG